jgi:heterotetrameric sarcosine oxidase delta subunit
MALMVPCPNCGRRPFTEFWCSGELPTHAPDAAADPDPLEADFQRVWLRRNVAGPQTERWFHAAGCRRWFTVTRNTLTNEIHDVA